MTTTPAPRTWKNRFNHAVFNVLAFMLVVAEYVLVPLVALALCVAGWFRKKKLLIFLALVLSGCVREVKMYPHTTRMIRFGPAHLTTGEIVSDLIIPYPEYHTNWTKEKP